jgi:hypothetical protein
VVRRTADSSSCHRRDALADAGPVEPLLLFKAALVALGLIAWWQYERTHRRRAGLISFGAAHAFQYSRDDPFDLVHLPLWSFHPGDGRGCENVVWGTWERIPLKLTDFWY